ncbi:MFS multidrug transporter, putative [Trichophyton benhamiae CBS 112371]|uniref:MFS multidrug transporter, putative n=1 Tax=Arthroderma benhamiae (strain ATCC MYA-4681 / CBS 112371) TaxID=663331 RepID=D4AWH6_ARTBC|nr:MFS multidrug transporter, putative [Trichophyton benhamiae CBS 112371]EFE32716.1 MFS multidrug transporter, putative [Trichophyton benhamiae CBS 112371]
MPLALVDRIGVGQQDVQLWVSILLSVYGGSILVGSPFFGYFADHCKLRRMPFVVGLASLSASTGLFALARSPPVLVIARTLQGLSAAAVWIVGLSIIADNVPTERVGEAMSYTTVALAWGSLLGPAVGGVMYEKVGFYGAFTVPMGLLAVDIAMRFAMIERKKSTQANDDSPISKSSLALPASEFSNESYSTFTAPGESSTRSISTVKRGDEEAPLLASSKQKADNGRQIEIRASATVFSLLCSPRLPLALVSIVMISLVVSSLDTTLPLFVMERFHWSSGGAGLIFMVPAIASFSTIYIAALASKIGHRIVAAAAFMLAGVSCFIMQLVQHDTTNDKVLLAGILFVLGACIATAEMIAMTQVIYAIEEHEAECPGTFGATLPIAQAYALFNMALAAGQLLGPVATGVIRVHAGWHALMITLGVCSVLMSLPYMLIRERKTEGCA